MEIVVDRDTETCVPPRFKIDGIVWKYAFPDPFTEVHRRL